jgi:hypothetical protein
MLRGRELTEGLCALDKPSCADGQFLKPANMPASSHARHCRA